MYKNYFFKQQMQDPYTPSAATTDQWAQDDALRTQAEKLAADRQAKATRIAEIKSRIAEIDRLIAEKHGPYAAAAEAARLGDFTPYLQLLSQQATSKNQAAMSAKGIENDLYNTEKLTWGLAANASDEDRAKVRSTIEAALRHAEEQGAKAGVDVSKNPSYQRLRSALSDADKASMALESERRRANELWSKARRKELTNADIAEIEDYIDRNPNSSVASDYRRLVEQYQPKTKENRAAFEKRKANAYSLWRTLYNLGVDEQAKRIGNLTPYERKLLEEFHPEMLK